MKIAIAQSKFLKFAILDNTRKICSLANNAESKGVNLIVFPELSLTGGYVGSLAEYSTFKENIQTGIENIARLSSKITIIVGSYYPENGTFTNSFLLFRGGVLEAVYPKKSIYNQTSSDKASNLIEANKATSHPTFTIEDTSFSVCFTDDFRDGIGSVTNTSDIILCSDITPFDYKIRDERQKLISNLAKNTNSNVIFTNQIGAHVHQIFDGGSFITNKSGEICLELPLFEEELAIFETETSFSTNFTPKEYSKPELIYKALILGIQEYFSQNGKKQAVVGLSGGIDSALVATLSAHALGNKNVHGILMPSMFSTDHSLDDAKNLAENLHITYDIVPINLGYNALMVSLNPIFMNKDFDITEENLQARLRAVILMSYSNKHGHLLVNTSNKSEAAAGYGTMYGDLCGGLALIGDLYKHEVYELANWINRYTEIIPQNTIHKAPSAELRPGQKDSDSLPDYDVLDKIVYAHIEEYKSMNEIIEMGFDREVVEKILHLIRINEYKRFQCPPCIRISKHAFGIDRNVPLVW